MTDIEIVTLAKIREALGIGHTHMLNELPEICRKIKHNSDRYEKVRKLVPNKFTQLWKLNLRGDGPETHFDNLIDELLTGKTVADLLRIHKTKTPGKSEPARR